MKAIKKLKKENARLRQRIPKRVTRQRVQSMLILALALLLLFQIGQISELREKVGEMDSLEETSTNVLQEWSEGKNFLTSFGTDLNEIRQFLLLPTKDYDFKELIEVVLSEEEEEEDLNTLLFTYVEKLAEFEENKVRYKNNLSSFEVALTETYWGEKGLKVSSEAVYGDESVDFQFFRDTDGSDDTETELFTVSLSYNGNFSVETYDGNLELTDKKSATVVLSDLKTFIGGPLITLKDKIAQINVQRAFLAKVLSSPTIQEALSQETLSVGTELESGERYYYQIVNSDHTPVAELSIQKDNAGLLLELERPLDNFQDQWILTQETAESIFLTAVLDMVDSRSERQVLIEENRKEVENIFRDSTFQTVLNQLGLQLGTMSETDTRISWPLTTQEGETLRVIFIDKESGEVKVELPEGEDAETLSMAIEAFDWYGKKKLSTPLLV